MSMGSEILISLSIEHEGRFDKMYDCICKSVRPSTIIDKRDLEYPAVTVVDEGEYPEVLKYMNCPPIVLFYRGNLALIDDKEASLRMTELDDKTRAYLGIKGDEWVLCCENIANVEWLAQEIMQEEQLKN